MSPLVANFVKLFGLVVAYFGLLFIAKRFFLERYRAQIVVVAVLVAFMSGFTLRRSAAPPDSVAPAASPSPVAATFHAQAPSEVGAACARARLIGTGKGHLDTANVRDASAHVRTAGGAALHPAEHVVVNGWAAASDMKTPATGACLVIDGKIVPGVTVLYGINRRDVGTAYQNPALVSTGFEITVPAKLVPSGAHTVTVSALASDGSAAMLSGDFQLSGPISGHRP